MVTLTLMFGWSLADRWQHRAVCRHIVRPERLVRAGAHRPGVHMLPAAHPGAAWAGIAPTCRNTILSTCSSTRSFAGGVVTVLVALTASGLLLAAGLQAAAADRQLPVFPPADVLSRGRVNGWLISIMVGSAALGRILSRRGVPHGK